jgi:hypothetical protein
MSKSPEHLTLVPKNKPATIAEIAEVEFGAIRELGRLSQVKRIKRIHEIVDHVRAGAVIGVEIATMDKAELVAKVAEKLDLWGPSLMELAHAHELANTLREIISAAEHRLAVALAVVEGDDGGDAAWLDAIDRRRRRARVCLARFRSLRSSGYPGFVPRRVSDVSCRLRRAGM